MSATVTREVRPCGDSGVLVEVADQAEALALHAALRATPPAGLTDLVPAACTVLIRVVPGTDLRSLAATVEELDVRPLDGSAGGAALEVPVVYDGADLDDVAALTGMSGSQVVAAHTGQRWTVAFAGFAPGFGYLVGEDERLTVPRRAEPRTAVPTGAVGLAGRFSGIYPRESPGGWQLLGRTELRTWDLDRDPPALLTPGTSVRFVEQR